MNWNDPMEVAGWKPSGVPGVYNNGESGGYLMVAVGRCDEFSDPRAKYVIRFKRCDMFGCGSYIYRWAAEGITPTEVRRAGTTSTPSSNAGLMVASASSYAQCFERKMAIANATQQLTGGQDINATMWTGGKNPGSAADNGGTGGVNGGYRADESGRYLAIGAIIILIAASLYILTR